MYHRSSTPTARSTPGLPLGRYMLISGLHVCPFGQESGNTHRKIHNVKTISYSAVLHFPEPVSGERYYNSVVTSVQV